MNVVYLLHFISTGDLAHARLHEHAGHYVGFCEKGLPSRLAYHRRGAGSRLLRAVAAAGRDFIPAMVWIGSRSDERKLKNRKATPRICPVCRGDAGVRRHRRTGTIYVQFRPRRRAKYERLIGGRT